MRVLLDSKDLIDVVEHGRPISNVDFAEYLQSRNHQVVLSFTSVREFSGPLLVNGDFLHLRWLLQQIERLPICYIREGRIEHQEITTAKRCFDSKKEYESINPYVRRWDETLFLGKSVAEILVNLRLDDIIFMIWRSDPNNLTFPTAYGERLRNQFEEERKLMPPVRKSLKRNFIDNVKRDIVAYSMFTDDKDVEAFAKWIYSDPHICPGFRLHYEAYHEVLANKKDIPLDSDIPDFAHIYAIPYVDAITFDRRMTHYCITISNKLKKAASDLNYADYIFPSLKAFLEANP
jgi:hypothetical protein